MYVNLNMMQQQSTIKIGELVIDPIYEGLLPLLSEEDFNKLEASVLRDGILHPFLINQDNVILDGYTRLRICRKYAIREVPFIVRTFSTKIEEEEFVLSFNLNRRHLTVHQKVELGLAILKIEMIKAKGRQKQAGADFGRSHPKELTLNDGDAVEVEKGEAIDLAAKKVCLGSETLRKAHRIRELAATDDDAKALWANLAEGKDNVHGAYTKLQEKKEVAKDLLSESKRFYVINVSPSRYDYEELKDISFPFSNENCMIWLWSSNQFLPSAFSLLNRWGFQYRTMLTWVKSKRKSGSKWLLDQTEHCLLATKGSPHINLTNQSTALIAASCGRHQKPEEFYSLLDSLCNGEWTNFFPETSKRSVEKEVE